MLSLANAMNSDDLIAFDGRIKKTLYGNHTHIYGNHEKKKKFRHRKNIEKQTSDTTITFKPASNVSSTKYATLPSFTAVGTGNTVVSNEYSFAVTTASTDAGGFGLRLSLIHI